MPLLLTFEEAAEEFRVSARTIRRMVDAGELPFVKIRGAVRLPYESLHEWVMANQQTIGQANVSVPASRSQAARELEALLAGGKKPMRRRRATDS